MISTIALLYFERVNEWMRIWLEYLISLFDSRFTNENYSFEIFSTSNFFKLTSMNEIMII